jgi:hypothetical protein
MILNQFFSMYGCQYVWLSVCIVVPVLIIPCVGIMNYLF